MNIVIDTNVLFSALIRQSRTRQLILDYEGEFLLPGFVFTELEQHRKEIQGKTGLGTEPAVDNIYKEKHILCPYVY